MRRDIEQEAEIQARKQFRLFVVLYIFYPAVILGLLSVIAIGAYIYIKRGTEIVENPPIGIYPPGCDGGGYLPASAPPSSGGGGYQSAIPSSGGSSYAPSITPPSITIPSMNPGVSAAGASARERIAYYVQVSIRAADGDLDARYDRNMISLSQYELVQARQSFVDRSRKDGKLGFLRLGITQLGADAFHIAEQGKLTVPFCPPNDFAAQDKRQAFVNLSIAARCDRANVTRAGQWLEALDKFEVFTPEERADLQNEAASYPAQVCFAQMAGATTPAPSGAYDDDYGADALDTTPPSPEAIARSQGGIPQSNEQVAAAHARELLNKGDAALAAGRLGLARRLWLQAIEAGKAVGAQSSIVAQKRIQTHTLTCHFDAYSISAISRDYKERSGDLIHLKVIQASLHALGHYDGPVNGVLSVQTRSAIRKFQREMAFDETDTLTPLQTVYVICNAAETARDLPSTNALGIMYVTGLGVTRNVDLALEWLRSASVRRHAEATWNLALIYGTGIVLHSYRLCDIPQNLDQADQYLREAANQAHPVAALMMQRHGGKTQEARWKAIEEDLSKYDERGVFKKTKEILTPLPPPKPGQSSPRCQQAAGYDNGPGPGPGGSTY